MTQYEINNNYAPAGNFRKKIKKLLGKDLSAAGVHFFLASNGVKGAVKNWHGKEMTVYRMSDVDSLISKLRKKNQPQRERTSEHPVRLSDYRPSHPQNDDDDDIDYDETDMEACSDYLIRKYQSEGRESVSILITESQRRRLFRC